MLKLAPSLTLLLLIGPVAAGLAGTILPAFGYFPALGGDRLSLSAFASLLATPGLWTSARLSLTVGLGATAGALAITVFFAAAAEGTPFFRRMRRLLSPLLSIPHAAAAFGLAFLVAPSGWIFRAVSPWATGFGQPPDLLIVHDPSGLAMMFGLMAKEVPFLFLMILAALPQTESTRSRRLAVSFGYRPVTAWLKVVLPRLYPQIRLPVFAVLTYATSVVDVALILGPTTPAPLAVRLTHWMNDPDLSLRFVASAGAIFQLGLSAAAILCWLALERVIIIAGRTWTVSGRRTHADQFAAMVAKSAMTIAALALALGLVVVALWSVAGSWRFPDALPASLTLKTWLRHLPDAATAVGTTVFIGLPVALVATGLALACLEGESRKVTVVSPRMLALLYLPLLVPQVAFLFGLQVLLLWVGLEDTPGAVAAAHLTFVIPYVFLALTEAWRSVDPRYGDVATALGARPDRVFWRVRLPMALRPVMTALALGFAVSVAQYLPTFLVGGGRVETVTTEAVALASGGDRRLVGVFAVLQMTLPFFGFLIAGAVTSLAFRSRRDLKISH
ncbi:ABC transporter permease subunit [Stappia sp. F7233]|uniref:ABC transporter permease subunit n=1 Tax=Stappia albiluteola TaxID=2758565 RepID=A0A839AC58_9HYPH|nr:ABC transporter permease subunit [Stappia albiluteola]MBA5776269.1 ABC transporter permease subunit [Stappia albiluteola]